MATPTTNDTLINQAACYKCIPDGAQPQVQTYLLDQLRNSLTAGWDDLSFDAARLTVTGGTLPGAYVGNSGPDADMAALRLTEPNAVNFWVTAQMPHTWVPGTRIYPHIHVAEQTLVTSNPLVFTVRYTIADIDGAFQSETVRANLAATVPAGSRYKHLIFDLPDEGIDMSAFKGPSPILRMKYTLTGPQGGSIDIISSDIHIFKSISPVAFTP